MTMKICKALINITF